MTASHDSMNLKVVTDQNLSYVLSNEEERATLLMDSLIILPASTFCLSPLLERHSRQP